MMRILAAAIQRTLRVAANPKHAAGIQGYFKTGKGKCGEGDVFLGIRMLVLRSFLVEFQDSPLSVIEKVLHSKFHEERIFALLLLVRQFPLVDALAQEAVFTTYLRNTRRINNWALVDSSSAQIVDGYLEKRNRKLLKDLASSELLWERRIAMIALYVPVIMVIPYRWRECFWVKKILFTTPSVGYCAKRAKAISRWKGRFWIPITAPCHGPHCDTLLKSSRLRFEETIFKVVVNSQSAPYL